MTSMFVLKMTHRQNNNGNAIMASRRGRKRFSMKQPDMLSRMPAALRRLCEDWSEALGKLSGYDNRLAYIQKALPELLLHTDIFSEILKNVMDGKAYPDIRQATAFSNEIVLFNDKNRMFSIRMYLWEPGEFTPIHDHNAWGVFGPVTGSLSVTKYVRKDTGQDDGYAQLKEGREVLLARGRTDTVLPLNDGIHRTGNPGEMTAATVHLYGNPVKRTYINYFDGTTGRIRRIYAPRARKRKLASEALRSLDADVESDE